MYCWEGMFTAPFPSNRSVLLWRGSHRILLLLYLTGHREPSSQCCLLDFLQNCCLATNCNIHYWDIASIVACWNVFTEVLPGNALIKSMTVYKSPHFLKNILTIELIQVQNLCYWFKHILTCAVFKWFWKVCVCLLCLIVVLKNGKQV
jgi:hypothetical protein